MEKNVWASLVAQTVKNLLAMQETWVPSLGWEDPLEKEMATHSSILAWRIPWTEEPGRLQSMGLQRVRHDWTTFTSFQKFMLDFQRWWRNRTGRPLSPSQIPQKNISTPSKLHKTTSVGWQRTSGNQKCRPLSSKTGGKKYKRPKRRQRRWGGSSVPGREACPGKGILRREVSKHQETLSLPSLWRALETQRAT